MLPLGRSSRPARTHTGGAWNAALLDVGPHLLDLHEVAFGEIVDVVAAGDGGWVSLTLLHASGRTSQASLSCRSRWRAAPRSRSSLPTELSASTDARRRSSGDRSEHPDVVRRGRTRRLAPRRRPPRPAPANAHRAGGATAPDVVCRRFEPLPRTADEAPGIAVRAPHSTGDVGFH